MTKYFTHDKKPSQRFLDSLRGGGQSQVECGCGRTHYAVWSDDDELPEEGGASYHAYLISEAEYHKKDNPEGVIIEYEYSSIEYKDLNSQLWVYDCPCNKLAIYETFIWEDKDSIRRYLKSRIDYEYQMAQEQLTLNVLAGI